MQNNIFKQSAILLKDNLMVIQPIFFFVLLLMVVVRPLLTKPAIDIGFIFAVILTIICSTAFLAGWYNSFKYVVSLKNKKYETLEERNVEQLNILKSFFPGVAEFLVPVTVLTFIYSLLAYSFWEGYRYFSFNVFSDMNFPKEFLNVMNSVNPTELGKYMQSNLNSEQVMTIFWLLIGGIIMTICFHLIVLWFAPAMFYTTKNPLKAIIEGIKFLFQNIKISFSIVAVMFGINLGISLLSVFTSNNFLSFIPLILSFIYLMYYVLTVFLYYEQKTQNNCPDGTECNG